MRMPCLLLVFTLVLFSQASLADFGFGFFISIDTNPIQQITAPIQEITAGMHEISCTAYGMDWYWEVSDSDYFRIEIDGKTVASIKPFGTNTTCTAFNNESYVLEPVCTDGSVIYNHTFEEGVTIVRCAVGCTRYDYYNSQEVRIEVRKLECPFEACIDDPRYIDKPCPEGYLIVDHSCEPIEPEPMPKWVIGIFLLIVGVLVYLYTKHKRK